MLTIARVMPVVRHIGDRSITSQLVSRDHEGRLPGGGSLELRLES